MNFYLIISGNPVDGFTYEGPYPTHDEARMAARGRNRGWWIAPLIPTEYGIELERLHNEIPDLS